MDWPNERYVRVYTRDTVTWKLLDHEARSVLLHMIRKVDRAGVIDVGRDGVFGLAAILELPADFVRRGVQQLVATRDAEDVPTVVYSGTAYVLPNFMAAQDAAQTDAHRKREERARRRDAALASQIVTGTSGNRTEQSTNGQFCHDVTEHVTPIRSELIRSDPSLAEPSRSRDPASASPSPPPTSEPRDGSIRGETKPRASRRKGALTPIPDDWTPRPSEVAKAGAMGLNADDQSERFRNHHGARGSVFANWDQAFRSWLDKAQEFSANRNGHRGPSRSIADIALDRALEAEAREKGTA